MKMKITIGLFFGGKSAEHEVSIITGLQAYNAFDRDKYEIVPVYITKSQEFYAGGNTGDIKAYSDIPKLLKQAERVILLNESGRVKLFAYNGKKFGKKPLCALDTAFLATHGTNVEDGALQGYFQTLGLPYTGSGVLSSAAGMDKAAMKLMLSQAGINLLPYLSVGAKRFAARKEEVLSEAAEKIGYPVIVKPQNLGSSIGIAKAGNGGELTEAVENALLFSDKVLIERAITRLKEINCAVLGDAGEAEASECEEPVSSGAILDFNDKYVNGDKNGGDSKTSGMASLKRKIPADMTSERRDEIRALAVRAFKALDCAGVARIDFMIDEEEDKIYFNEINTIPGSMAFYLWEPAGLKYKDLLDRIVMLSFKRERERKSLNFAFESNILAGFKGGMKGKS